MIRVGLTGGIASGKSTVAKQFATLGAAIFDADATVHQLMRHDKNLIQTITKLFPEAIENEHISRQKLGKIVFQEPDKLKQLEAIVHPAVHDAEYRFIQQQCRLGKKLVICDIPLLFETGADARMDVNVLVSCPLFLQRIRALRRSNMTPEKLNAIMQQQMPLHEKRKRADFEIATGLGKAYSYQQVQTLVNQLMKSHA